MRWTTIGECARSSAILAIWALASAVGPLVFADEPPPAAQIVGDEAGWRSLLPTDFVKANCDDSTWKWSGDVLACSGTPVGVIRSTKQYRNFELSLQWRHLKSAGNSGVFVWTTPESLSKLKPNQLPHGIEVQVLDTGYTQVWEKSSGKKADWFTCHGDVFPVGESRMKPFSPLSPDRSRSFPSAQRSKSSPEWNHYYIRAINGEVRLWVNGQEVSGGTGCQPAVGFLCLESEGSPIEFKNLKIRELP